MIRVAHTGDIHLTFGPRFEDGLAVLDWLIDDAIAADVNVWLVLGDLFGTTELYRTVAAERNAFAARLERMADVGPVLVLDGNHDGAGELDLFARLRGTHPIMAVTEPTRLLVGGDGWGMAYLYALPFPQRAPAAGPITEQIAAATAALADQVRAWGADVRALRADPTTAAAPAILAYHGTVKNALVAGGEVMREGQEVELDVADLAPFDYVACGHIHRRQQMAANAWYAGSPWRSNFGETDEKGYLLVDVEAGQPPQVQIRTSPSRRFVTLDATWTGDRWEQAEAPDVQGAEVRVRCTIPEEHLATADMAVIETTLRAAGAEAWKIERRTVPTSRVRSEAIIAARTTAEKVQAYWQALGETAPGAEACDRMLGKLEALEHEAAR